VLLLKNFYFLHEDGGEGVCRYSISRRRRRNTLFRVVRDDEEELVETVAVYEEMGM
jgi:hypothetical protein